MTYCVNCVHCDTFGRCNKKPKRFLLFKQSCVEYGTFSQNCEIAERFPRPKPPKGNRERKE